MPDEDKLTAILLMRAALPLTKTLLEEKPELARKYAGWNRVIQFQVENDPELACHLQFVDGRLDYIVGRHPAPQIDFVFKKPAAFIALMTGKIALPRIKGALKNFGTLAALDVYKRQALGRASGSRNYCAIRRNIHMMQSFRKKR